MIRRCDLNFHKRIKQERPVSFMTRISNIVRYVGTNGGDSPHFVDPARGGLMRLHCVSNGFATWAPSLSEHRRAPCQIHIQSTDPPLTAFSNYFQIDLNLSVKLTSFRLSYTPQPPYASIHEFPLYGSHLPSSEFVRIWHRRSTRHHDVYRIVKIEVDNRLPVQYECPIRFRYLRFYVPETVPVDSKFTFALHDIGLQGTVYDSFDDNHYTTRSSTSGGATMVSGDYLRRITRGISHTLKQAGYPIGRSRRSTQPGDFTGSLFPSGREVRTRIILDDLRRFGSSLAPGSAYLDDMEATTAWHLSMEDLMGFHSLIAAPDRRKEETEEDEEEDEEDEDEEEEEEEDCSDEEQSGTFAQTTVQPPVLSHSVLETRRRRGGGSGGRGLLTSHRNLIHSTNVGDINRKTKALAPAFDPRPNRTNVSIYTDFTIENLINELVKAGNAVPSQNEESTSDQQQILLSLGEESPLELNDSNQTLIYYVLQHQPDAFKKVWDSGIRLGFSLVAKSEVTEAEYQPQFYDQSIYSLLRRIFDFMHVNGMNENDVFVGERFRQLINEQLKQSLVVAGGCIPNALFDLVHQHPYLFPLEQRTALLRSSAFGTSRSMIWLLQKSGVANDFNYSRAVGRLKHERFFVSRDSDLLLEHGCLVLEYHARHKSELEVLWVGEDGTGLGPTLEFYTHFSLELQRAKLALWLSSVPNSTDNPEAFVHPTNLFPAPYPPYMKINHVLRYFKCIGIFLGKCLLDQRFCDLDLSIELIERFCPNVTDRPAQMKPKRIQTCEEAISRLSKVDEKYAQSLTNLLSSNVEIESLCLNFAYFPSSNAYGFTMCPISDEHPCEEIITNETIETYIISLANFMLYDGVQAQVDTLISGLSEVFRRDVVRSLQLFTPNEFALVVGGERNPCWTREELVRCVDAKNGYNEDSPTFIHFLDAMMLFEPSERSRIVQFITGSRSLPIGGIAALMPRLTVAKKLNGGYPSVNTCNHFLKLPEYKNALEMKEKLLFASLEKGFYFN